MHRFMGTGWMYHVLREKGWAKWYDYVRMVGLLVDRGRIDKNATFMVGFPFWVYACIAEVRVMRTAGGLRADSLKGPQTPHSTLLFFSMFDFTHTGRHSCEDGQDCGSVSLGCR
jgi:hypothetical protein